jgi:AcrR family transcriptional regulator
MDAETEPVWRQRRREAILEAAAALFARQAYHTVQMDEVAREAGVGKATLYRYFASKEELYLESLDRALSDLGERLHRPPPPGTSPAAALAGMVSALLETFDDRLPALKAMGDDHSCLAERSRRLVGRRSTHIAEALGRVMAAGEADGTFRAVDPLVTPHLVIGMVRGAVMTAGDQPRERLKDAILAFVEGGVRTRSHCL